MSNASPIMHSPACWTVVAVLRRLINHGGADHPVWRDHGEEAVRVKAFAYPPTALDVDLACAPIGQASTPYPEVAYRLARTIVLPPGGVMEGLVSADTLALTAS